MRLTQKVYISLIILFVALCTNEGKSQCSIQNEIPVVSLTSKSEIISVSGLINDDLASNTQALCGVFVHFKHDVVGELALRIQSPSGQSISLIGPQGSFGYTSNTTWQVTFTDAPASPDAGFPGQWDSNQPWGNFANYNGIYNPTNAPLSSLNYGSANGDWVVTAEDYFPFANGYIEEVILYFCDPTGLSCNPCAADAGDFEISDIQICESDLNLIELIPQYSGDAPNSTYQYYYIVHQNDEILSITPELNLEDLSPGEYDICGFSISEKNGSQIEFYADFEFSELITFFDTATIICGDIMNECTYLEIYEKVPLIHIDTTLCLGQVFEYKNNTITSSGTYTFTEEIANSCPQEIIAEVDFVDLNVNFELSSDTLTCDFDTIVIDARNSDLGHHTLFEWTTIEGNIIDNTNDSIIYINQPGLYQLTIKEGGCEYTNSIIIPADNNFPELTITADSIFCVGGETQLQLISSVNLIQTNWNGPNGFYSNVHDPFVNEAGIYEVVVLTASGCITSKEIYVAEKNNYIEVDLTTDSLSCLKKTVEIVDQLNQAEYTYTWQNPDGSSSIGHPYAVNVPGFYQVTVTDESGCTVTDEILVEGDLSAIPISITIPTFKCEGEIHQIIIDSEEPIVGLFEWTGPNGETFPNSSTITISSPGVYNVGISSQGCYKNIDIEVPFDDSKHPIAEPYQIAPLSCDSPVIKIFANVVENSGNVLQYHWSGPSGFSSYEANPYVSLPGTYFLNITTLNNCPLTFKYTLEVSIDFPTVDIDTINGTCNQALGGLILEKNNYNDSLHVSGPGGYSENGEDHLDLIPGLYLIEVFDSTGCSTFFKVPIAADTLPPNVKIVQSNKLDCSHSNLKLFTSGGLSNYLWTLPNNTTSTSDTLITSLIGQYSLVGVGSNGCVMYDTTEVEMLDDAISISAEDKVIDCTHTSVVLHVESDKNIASYDWSGPNFSSTLAQPIISQPGLYQVLVLGENGCVGSTNLNVMIDTIRPADVQLSFDHTLGCLDTTAVLAGNTSTLDVDYQWLGPHNFMENGEPAVIVNAPGFYIFNVTSSNGCSVSKSIELKTSAVYPNLTTMGDTLFCDDDLPKISVSSDITNVKIEWNGPNFTSQMASNIVDSSGIYYVMVTTDKGCTTIDSAEVIFQNEIPKIELAKPVDTLNCQIHEVMINVDINTSVTDLEWTGPNNFSSNNQNIIVSENGEYQLYVVAENRCEENFTVDIIIDTLPPPLDLEAPPLTCDNESIAIIGNSSSSVTHFEWTGPKNYYSSTLDSTYVFYPGIYYVDVIGGNYCKNRDSIEVTVDYMSPQIEVRNDTLNCDYNQLALPLYTDNSSYSFEWKGPMSFSSNEMNPLTDQSGVYFVTITGENGCSSSESLQVFDLNYYPEFQLSKNNDITCESSHSTLSASEILSTEQGRWIGPNSFNSTEKVINVNQSGEYFYEVIGFTGCITKKSIQVEADTFGPSVMINQIGEYRCDEHHVSINAEGSEVGEDVLYSWSSISGQIYNGQHSLYPKISGLGIYIFESTNLTNGCISVDTYEIKKTESTLEDFMVEVQDISCHPDSLGYIKVTEVIGGDAPYEYALKGYSFDTIGHYNQLIEGKYTISVKDSFGCVINKDINLNTADIFNVNLGEDLEIVLGDNVEIVGETSLFNSEIDSVIWIPNFTEDCNKPCLEYVISPTENTKVILTVVDNNGCKNSDEIIILVNDEIEIYVPNIFSPNGDGINDILKVSSSIMVKEVNSFKIFDRWGSLVHEDYNFIPGNGRGWDGMHRDDSVVIGVYPYILEITLINDTKHFIKGSITLIK